MDKAQRQELIELLRETAALGLTFDVGRAYISRGYVDKQAELRARIDAFVALLADEQQTA